MKYVFDYTSTAFREAVARTRQDFAKQEGNSPKRWRRFSVHLANAYQKRFPDVFQHFEDDNEKQLVAAALCGGYRPLELH